MTRKLAVLVVAGLTLAPAASAKGPNATLISGPEAVAAGRTWTATLEFNELRRPAQPRVVATRGERRVVAKLRPVPTNIIARTVFRLRMVFPTEGRWRLTVGAGKRRFAFPPVEVGIGVVPRDYIAFQNGSVAARDGAGGVWTMGPDPDHALRGKPLPPEVVSVAEPPSDEGGIPLWMPFLGLALAGVGVLGLRGR